MDDIEAHPAADGLLGGDATHSGPTIMEVEQGSDAMYLTKLRGAVLDSSVPPADEQAKLIEDLEAEDITAGEQMYIISKKWWADWCAYTNFRASSWDSNNAADDSEEGTCPQSIDNSDISGIDADDDLRPGLEEDRDFVIVRGKSWELLSEWYGGGPAIERSAVLEGLAPNNKRPRVNPYPMKLEVCWGGKPDDVKPIKAEQSESVASLKERACKVFGLDADKVEIWDFFHRNKYGSLEDKLDLTLEESRILEGQDILLDEKAAPLVVEEKSSSPIITSFGVGRSPLNRMNSLHAEDYTVQRTDAKPGLAGLSNLGNTCFMNSSLQCLMHSVPIMSVFLSGQYEQHLNRTNPLGMKGQLATAFGSLMNNIWKSDVGTVCPKGFKARIAQFAPQFSGYQQHDSQEFLAFLLDGLHEDINRIQHKPYIEEADSDGVPDNELAARAWQNYRLRNDSHIVDHFQGLYKSTLVCPQCSYSSVKFDPFMYLSLPLPESRVKQMTVVLVLADGSAPPREYGLEVPQTGTLKDLYIVLARVAHLDVKSPEQQMVYAKISNGYFFSFETYEDPKTRLTELCRESYDRKTSLVYYYRHPEQGPTAEGVHKVLVLHRKAEPRGKGGKFSAPLVLWLPLSETYDPQLHVISSQCSRRNSLTLGSPASSRDTEYIVAEDAPIWRHIRHMLRPFLAVPSLRQQPPPQTVDDAADMQQDEPQQQQESVDGDLAVESEVVPGSSATASPQHQQGADTGLSEAQDIAATAAEGADGSPAVSVVDEHNSTWGSHGSDSVRSMEQDLTGCDLEGQQPATAAAAGSEGTDVGEAAAAADDDDDEVPELLVEEVDDGEPDPTAAAVVQEVGLDGSSAAASGSTVLVGAGGVPLQPLDIWATQQQLAPQPISTAADPEQQAVAESTAGTTADDVHWPPYLLKLAREAGDYPTTFTSWSLNRSDPVQQHHHCFVLEWEESAGYTLPYEQYQAAAAAEAQHAGQQSDQQQHGNSSSSSSSSFWMPNLSCCREDGSVCPPAAVGDLLICGDYVLTALHQPEFDPSTQPIKAARSAPGGKSVGLESCVEAFLQPEQLSEADEWYCPKCKTHVQADKKLDLWSLPEVLVVHLKRFSYTRWNRDKLDTQVLFPLEQLNLSQYVLNQQEQPPIYDCYAVSNHYGGLGGGHYTAFAQMPNDKKWYCFDDSRVDDIAPDGVQSRAAYVLFYRRRQQAQQDQPDLVEQLLHQQQQHLQQKWQQQQQEQDQAAAAAVGPNDAASGMETDPGPVLGGSSGAAAAAGPAEGAAAPSSPGQVVEVGTWGSPAVAPSARATSPSGDENNTPASPLPMMPDLSSRAVAARNAAADTSTSTSSRGIRGAEEDADSSDGSSSRRPRGGSRAAAAQSGSGVATELLPIGDPGGDSDSYTPLGAVLQAVAVADRPARRSDQGLDADMADRDV